MILGADTDQFCLSFSATPKAAAAYLPAMNDSLRLLTATFNWLSHARKDVIRNDVRDPAMHEFCSWDVAVGESLLFPFDVTKKADEVRKTKKLGSSHHHQKQRRPKFQQKNTYRPTQNNTYSYGKPKGKKSFLGNSSQKKKRT